MNTDPHAPPDVSDLSALFINCTLKRSPRRSNTRALMDVSREIMDRHGVETDVIRAVDREIAPGVQSDMTNHGVESDDWPDLSARVKAADILVVGTPIWLGEESSVCRRVVERLYSESGETNEKGQYVWYGRAAGCVITGNEDGLKHCAMGILYALGHIGFSVPPQADAGWVGEAGPGASYADEGSGGPENEFTQRSVTFMTWNLLHAARHLRDEGGIPRYGTSREDWDAGFSFGHPNRRPDS